MELTWYGRTCVRLRGKDAVVVSDPFQSVVGPTGRGITGDIVIQNPMRSLYGPFVKEMKRYAAFGVTTWSSSMTPVSRAATGTAPAPSTTNLPCCISATIASAIASSSTVHNSST